ncbi:MAG: FKBP-type peptidyl-prolyl cis-trans isomerase [Saprospiraceae bacterium]|nr:FKBP-type peptidyl-prolyl cis-trans isomerase [Saprospiraceae bacterium]
MRFDGTLLFSTDQIGHPIKFLIGGNQAIEGLDLGVCGMQQGEIRTLVVPPKLSQRTEFPENQSPDSTLYYEVELMEIIR